MLPARDEGGPGVSVLPGWGGAARGERVCAAQVRLRSRPGALEISEEESPRPLGSLASGYGWEFTRLTKGFEEFRERTQGW